MVVVESGDPGRSAKRAGSASGPKPTRSAVVTAPTGSGPDVLSVDPGLGWLHVAAESGDLTVFDHAQPGLVDIDHEHPGDDAHSVAVEPKTHHVALGANPAAADQRWRQLSSSAAFSAALAAYSPRLFAFAVCAAVTVGAAAIWARPRSRRSSASVK